MIIYVRFSDAFSICSFSLTLWTRRKLHFSPSLTGSLGRIGNNDVSTVIFDFGVESVEAEGQQENRATAGEPAMSWGHRGHCMFRGSSMTTKGTSAGNHFPSSSPCGGASRSGKCLAHQGPCEEIISCSVGTQWSAKTCYMSRFFCFVASQFFFWWICMFDSFICRLIFALHSAFYIGTNRLKGIH